MEAAAAKQDVTPAEFDHYFPPVSTLDHLNLVWKSQYCGGGLQAGSLPETTGISSSMTEDICSRTDGQNLQITSSMIQIQQTQSYSTYCSQYPGKSKV